MGVVLRAWILRLFSLKFFLSFEQRGAQALSCSLESAV